MREHNKYPEARLYEWVDPEVRFVGMADIIIAKQGVEIPASSPFAPSKLVANWISPSGDYTYRIALTDKGAGGGQEYLVERYRQEGPIGIATDRYFVKRWRDELTPFEKIDQSWRPIELSEDEKRAETRIALDILSSKDRREADAILNLSLEKRFPEVAAVIAMSDLAVTSDEPAIFIDEAAAHKQKEALVQQRGEFEKLMGKIATKENGYFDQELHNHLYHGAEPDIHNNFRDFDLRAEMVAVAKSIGATWQNRITPDHHDFIK